MTINGVEYRLSGDCSLWTWTARGQHVISHDKAMAILLGSSNPQAWAWANLIHSRDQSAKKQGIASRLRQTKNANWGST